MQERAEVLNLKQPPTNYTFSSIFSNFRATLLIA